MSVSKSSPLQTRAYAVENRGLEYQGNLGNPVDFNQIMEVTPDAGSVWEIQAIHYQVEVHESDESQDDASENGFVHWELTFDDQVSSTPNASAIGNSTPHDSALDIHDDSSVLEGDNQILLQGGGTHIAGFYDTTDGIGHIQADQMEDSGFITFPEPFELDFRSELNFNLRYSGGIAAGDTEDAVLFLSAHFTFYVKEREANV